MAKIYITEHPYPTEFLKSSLPVVKLPPLASQVLTVSGSSNQSAQFQSTTRIIGVHVDSSCSIEAGDNPVATINSKRIAANSTEYFEVLPGYKLAVILNT